MTLQQASFWLLPTNPSPLEAIIDALCSEFGTPKFAPHVTVHCTFEPCTVGALTEALERARSVAALPITLEVSSIGHSKIRFKTVFLEFLRDSAHPVHQIHASLAEGLPSTYVCDPHLSLIYQGDMPVEPRQKVADRLLRELKGMHFEFNRIALISPGDGQENFENIERWKILETR